jgi:catalase
VLYDAVVLLTTKEQAERLAMQPAARDFVTDAFAHKKFVGYVEDAAPLFAATGLAGMLDEGFVRLGDGASPGDFVATCRALRFWDRP